MKCFFFFFATQYYATAIMDICCHRIYVSTAIYPLLFLSNTEFSVSIDWYLVGNLELGMNQIINYFPIIDSIVYTH